MNKSSKTCKTPLGNTGCLGNPLLYWLPKHPVFKFTLPLTQLVRPPMATYPLLCCPCVTYGTLCHAIGHQVLPNPLDAYESFFCHCLMSPALHPGFSGLWGPQPALSSTPTLGGFFLFFNSITCDLWNATHPTPLPREADDFPRGDKHFKHVPLPTYLIYLSPKGLYR